METCLTDVIEVLWADMKLEVTTESADQTMQFASVLAHKLQGGEIIELIGDVGAGKTTFTKGLVAGLESISDVTSPTFSISNVYDDGLLPVYHFDFYRLDNNDEMIKHELVETVEHDNAVIILEWAQAMRNVLDRESIKITIEAPDVDQRRFSIEIPKMYHYIGGAA